MKDDISRRKFIYHTGIAGAAIVSSPLFSLASDGRPGDVTVGKVMDLFMNQVPGGPIANTVDTLKSGSRDTVVTGIVTTMFATIEVIKKAIQLNANFIIAHEPAFYNHQDQTDWLKDSDVYQYKINLLNKHNIAVWRNHDHIHTMKPDGIYDGITKLLGWEKYAGNDRVYNLPPTKLGDLITFAKHKLNIPMVRFIGDPDKQVSKVLLMVGAAGGTKQINYIMKTKPDVVLAGEISEWETAEYVRDAQQKGDNLSLVVLGHIASEEPGSEFMVSWLKQNFPGIKATHIPSGNSLAFM